MQSDLTHADSTTLSEEDTCVDVEFVVKVIKKLCLVLLIYSFGYFGLHFLAGSVLIIFIFDKIRSYTKKRKLQVAQKLALGHEEEIIRRVLSTLPTWVKFSEVEKVEWLNKIFELLWQQVNTYAENLLPTILEPAIQNYVSDFKFTQIVLGNAPLKIQGVKVYEILDKRKIVMDLDILYDGDCYVTFKTFKFTGGIKDIQLQGCLRVVLTPLIARLPLIGGLQAYFMKSPKIDFELIKVTQILDIPGIRSRIKNVTKSIINSMYLYPNAFSINLETDVNMSKLAVLRTEGILRVHIIEAKNLVNKDLIGKSDPYVVLQVGAIKVQSPVISNCLNPKWDFWCEFEIVPNSEMKIEVWDKDDATSDDFLGHARIDISQVVKIGQSDMPIPLQGVDKGIIYLRLTWLSLSSNYSDLDLAIQEIKLLNSSLHTALLMVYLESSLNLPTLKKIEPSPFLKLEIEDHSKQTDTERETCSPAWDKGFTFLIRNPKKAILKIQVYDEVTKQLLGNISYEIDKLKNVPGMQLRRQTFFFDKPYTEASICCWMKLGILKNQYVEEKSNNADQPRKMLIRQGSSVSTSAMSDSDSDVSNDHPNTNDANLGQIKLSLSYNQQRQRLLIDIKEVNINSSKYSDINPYVTVVVGTDKKKTKVVKNTSNPHYNEQFDYLLTKHDLCASLLTLNVKSKGLFGTTKKFLGKIVINLTHCDGLSAPYTDWFNLKPKEDSQMYYLD